MKTITTDQREVIDALLAEEDVGGISAAILEKDIHVTDALRALSAIAHEHVKLVFCGGKCGIEASISASGSTVRTLAGCKRARMFDFTPGANSRRVRHQ